MKRQTIALDCDGVLLNYSLAYASLWERAFGEYPKEKNPDAYSHFDRWDIRFLENDELSRLKSCMDYQFWSTMPAIEGSIQACNDLVCMGYDIVCVSAIDESQKQFRLSNLKSLGFPIDVVHATGSKTNELSPKAKIINEIRPIYFVDDYADYFLGIECCTNRVLIHRNQEDSPNTGQDWLWDHEFPRLDEFVHWLKIKEGV